MAKKSASAGATRSTRAPGAKPRKTRSAAGVPGVADDATLKKERDAHPATGVDSKAAPGRLESTAVAVGRALGQTTAAIVEHLPWGERRDGLARLEHDHRELEAILEAGLKEDAASGDSRRGLLGTLAALLKTHEVMEEQVLYPALKAHPEAKDIVLEGFEEHHVANVVVEELKALSPSAERWGAKWKVLKESIEHHIEEEEGDMFKTARKVFSQAQLDELGSRMQALKDQSPAKD